MKKKISIIPPLPTLLDIMKIRQENSVTWIKQSNHCKKSELEAIAEANYDKAAKIKDKKLFVEENLNMILEQYVSLSQEEVDAMIEIVLEYGETI